ncbi:2-C-methyl-D-erythritol 2,4-cyclodiphosphate synthase [Desulfoferrobacter suflitae]|uniref:2-C-methyl-D-erythritol 2,4-cyclodiphosphate synthase n=1 Tax=Desulfoferrobacter suflitae TaxID=2865782 RepID=UPI002164B8E1|nr:2-C-methyl-D-erythritol 2,4-cyclodiphosphate synthase [Desulfoferrobacter suflitae]MCK8603137.1 2-C-methyl-D-erythritol 2,4-cyclodiphosphate synthase [Desulfoferrobacter suflitae]
MRVGFGYDVHAFAEGRSLILGGVEIGHDRGLLGHSDADVLLHAMCDALLGAAAMGDIGQHFPDNNPEYRGISSIILLEKTVELLAEQGFTVVNIDTTLVVQKPRIAGYIPKMIKKISSTLKIPANCISIKATTTEKLGFAGRQEGIAAYAVALINKTG